MTSFQKWSDTPITLKRITLVLLIMWAVNGLLAFIFNMAEVLF